MKLMGGRHKYEPSMAGQSFDNKPVLINLHSADANAKRFEEPSYRLITRILDGNLITRLQQGPSHDIQRLLSAAHDSDIGPTTRQRYRRICFPYSA